MLPHSSILSLPPTQKSRRRTVHFGAYNSKLRCSSDEIHVRELTIDQVGLGCAIWDGAIVLARWIFQNQSLFVGKSVLELGGGIGLPTLMAGRYASSAFLTDYLNGLLLNGEYNKKLNTNLEEEYEESNIPQSELDRRCLLKKQLNSSFSVHFLDWHEIEDFPGLEDYQYDKEENREENKKEENNTAAAASGDEGESSDDPPYQPFDRPAESIDYIIGTEIMYTNSSQHRHCLARTLYHFLKPGGFFYCVQSANREGVEQFIELLIGKYGISNIQCEKLDSSSGLLGNYQLGRKVGKGNNEFVQREEDYYFYTIQKPLERPGPQPEGRERIDPWHVVPNLPKVKFALNEEKIRSAAVGTIEERDKIQSIMAEIPQTASKDLTEEKS